MNKQKCWALLIVMFVCLLVLRLRIEKRELKGERWVRKSNIILITYPISSQYSIKYYIMHSHIYDNLSYHINNNGPYHSLCYKVLTQIWCRCYWISFFCCSLTLSRHSIAQRTPSTQSHHSHSPVIITEITVSYISIISYHIVSYHIYHMWYCMT